MSWVWLGGCVHSGHINTIWLPTHLEMAITISVCNFSVQILFSLPHSWRRGQYPVAFYNGVWWRSPANFLIDTALF